MSYESDLFSRLGGNKQPNSSLLYIETSPIISEEPLIDEVTQKMTAAFRLSEDTGMHYRGIHMCACGACSSNTDYILPNCHQTNSLAVHYLALHRSDAPEDQIEIVEGFDYGIAEPSIEEIVLPPR